MATEFERYRGWSKTFMIFMIPILFMYFLGHAFRLVKTESETKPGPNMNDKLLSFLKVIEIDMAYPLLMYFIMIEMTAFHEFAFFTSMVLVANTFILSVMTMLPNDPVTKKRTTLKRFWIIICKLTNVVLVVLAFIQIFISDHSFDIKDDLELYLGMSGQLMNSTSYPIKNPSSINNAPTPVPTVPATPTVETCPCKAFLATDFTDPALQKDSPAVCTSTQGERAKCYVD